MEYGDLIYLKSKRCIAKYIIYKEDDKVHLVQKAVNIDYVGKPYYEVKKKDIDEAISQCDIQKYLEEEVLREKDKIDELYDLRKSLKGKEYYKEKIDNLEEQIERIKAKEETPERLASIKQLEKAIRRKQTATKRDYKKEDEEVYLEIRKREDRLLDLKKELSYIKRINKKSS